MKKLIVGIVFFLSGFFSVLLLRILSVENPVAIRYNGETNFDAFLREWSLNPFYQVSIWIAVFGAIVILIEPATIVYHYVKAKATEVEVE